MSGGNPIGAMPAATDDGVEVKLANGLRKALPTFLIGRQQGFFHQCRKELALGQRAQLQQFQYRLTKGVERESLAVATVESGYDIPVAGKMGPTQVNVATNVPEGFM